MWLCVGVARYSMSCLALPGPGAHPPPPPLDPLDAVQGRQQQEARKDEPAGEGSDAKPGSPTTTAGATAEAPVAVS